MRFLFLINLVWMLCAISPDTIAQITTVKWYARIYPDNKDYIEVIVDCSKYPEVLTNVWFSLTMYNLSRQTVGNQTIFFTEKPLTELFKGVYKRYFKINSGIQNIHSIAPMASRVRTHRGGGQQSVTNDDFLVDVPELPYFFDRLLTVQIDTTSIQTIDLPQKSNQLKR